VTIRQLSAADDRRRFACGQEDLDRYFRQFAGQHARRGIARIDVACLEEEIIGYSASAPGHIEATDLPAELARRLPRYPLPVLRLARLAVATGHQGRGVGRLLIRNALRQAMSLRDQHGCVGVVVDAKSEALGYYASFGFSAFEAVAGQIEGAMGPTTPLFLPMKTIELGLRHGLDS